MNQPTTTTTDSSNASIEILGEDELSLVVGGCSRGRRHHYKHCGKKRERDYGCGRRGYERGDGSNYEAQPYEEAPSFELNNNIDIDITINQVAG